MYLGNPLLPVKLSEKKAVSLTKKLLEEKNWVSVEKIKTLLVLEPYFFFGYHYFKEKVSDSEKIVNSSVDGFSIMHGSTLKIDLSVLELIQNNFQNASNNLPPHEFIKKDFVLNKKEMEDVIKLKIAESFKISNQNIILSNIKKVYVPFYEIFFMINGKETIIKINAVDKKILNPNNIPIKEKTVSELTKETFQELSEPKNWLAYTKEIFVKIFDFLLSLIKKNKKSEQKNNSSSSSKIKHKINLSFFSSNIIWFIIILLALLLIFIALF